MKADATTETAVQAVLSRLSDIYRNRDMDGLLSLVASDPDVVLYGTGADEKRIGQAQIQAQAERDWSQSEEASISYQWTSVSAAGSVAWAASDVVFNIRAEGQTMALPGRMTCVLEKRGDRWLIVQMHVSFPSAEQQEGESFPT